MPTRTGELQCMFSQVPTPAIFRPDWYTGVK
jgi:hypothetical protein